MGRTRFFILFFLFSWTLGFGQIPVTFTVDIPGLEIGLGGVHVAGEFLTVQSVSIQSDWNPAAQGSALQLVSENTYSVTVYFPASSVGKTMLFQFSRDSVWSNENGDISEGNPGDCCLDLSCATPGGAGGFDRSLVIPQCGGEYKCEWNHCGSLAIVEPPGLNVTPGSQSICKGDTVRFKAESGSPVFWGSNLGLSCTQCSNPIAIPLNTTTYSVKAEKGACVTTASVTIVPEIPFLSVPSDTLICQGKSVQIQAMGTGTFVWSPPDGLNCEKCLTPEASPLQSTLYRVHTELGTCSLNDSILIQVDTQHVKAGIDRSILYGESTPLDAFGIDNFTWSPAKGLSCSDCREPIGKPESTTIYKVSSLSANGCLTSDSLTVFVQSVCGGLFFPNLITANVDKQNDRFTLPSIANRQSCKLNFQRFQVYNRWGIKEFDTQDPDFAWPEDGDSVGVYFYVITFSEQKWNGWFQLVY